MVNVSPEVKKDTLIKRLKELPSLLVAFSGGVDSTFLLAAAHEALGSKIIAVTANSFVHPQKDFERAMEFAGQLEIEHIVFESSEIDIPEFRSNPPDRCYHCKKALCERLLEIAAERGITHIAHAINMDDLGDYRPGIQAAEEMGLIAPLVESGLSKDEIRSLSKEMGLITWNKPAMACLASRIPYGTLITKDKIHMIEKAEALLEKEGFKQYRVRHHDTVARIEVELNEINKFMDEDFRKKIARHFKDIGFKHIALDMEGFISGSMNREINRTAENHYES